MGFDVHQPYIRRRTMASIGLVLGCVIASGLAVGTPANAAKATADLSATLINGKVKPGHRVSYVIKVTNHGPSTAHQVKIDFFTSRTMSSPVWHITRGRCIRGPRETTCLVGTMKRGQTVKATISGVISKKLHKGDPISNKVVLGSNTHLVNTANDTVTDNFRIGIPKKVATAPLAAVNADSKIAKITHVATDALDVTSRALTWSIVALGAAALWFAIGLTLRARKRRRSPSPDFD